MTIDGLQLGVPSPGGKSLEYVYDVHKQDDLLTTGICSREYFPYNLEKEVLPTLRKSINPNEYNEAFWSCHEMALWGIANIRYQHPGCRTAIALGKRGDVDHSLIVLWNGSGDDWVYYDSAAEDPGRPILTDDDFKATKIVNFPPAGIGSKSVGVPGFEKFQKKNTGFLVLNPDYSVDALAGVTKDLNALSDQIASDIKNKKNFPTPAGVTEAIFKKHFVVHDRVLLECMKLRKKYRDTKFPIGMAFGKLADKKDAKSVKTLDYATLAYWDGPNKSPIYWGLVVKDLKDRKNLDFEPRVVIV